MSIFLGDSTPVPEADFLGPAAVRFGYNRVRHARLANPTPWSTEVVERLALELVQHLVNLQCSTADVAECQSQETGRARMLGEADLLPRCLFRQGI